MGFVNKLFSGTAGMCGKNLRWELTGDTLTISGTGEMEEMRYGSYNPWYDYRESIEKIIIERGVTAISNNAFCWYCYNLTSVTIGNSVTTIGNGAFCRCERLTSVIIPDSVTTIGKEAFDGCIRLTSVTIGNSVTTIGDYAFCSCESLTSVTFPESIKTIGDGAFSGCYSLTSITIPAGVTSIGKVIFSRCTSLKEIHYPAGRGFEKNLSQGNNAKLIPYNVTQQPIQTGTCGANLRWELSGDTLTISGTGDMANYRGGTRGRLKPSPWDKFNASIKKIIVNDGVTAIGDWAFDYCTEATEVKLPNFVTKIGDGAFYNCSSLTSVIIPASVTRIGSEAFSGCYSLEKVTIPATKIGKKIFGRCNNLKEIYYPSGCVDIFLRQLSEGHNAKLIPYNVTQPTTRTGKDLKFYPVQSTPQQRKFYPAQPTKSVAEKLTWSFTGKTLTVGGVREIKNFPYAQIPWIDHLHDIQRIIIGNGVEKISAHAFDECPRLEILELPASVKTIGDMAFSVCFCGSINGRKNVFWSLEDGVLVLKKNPDMPPTADFSTGAVSWIFAEKNIRSVKLEDGVKPTEKFFSWLTQRFNGKEISFG